MLFGYPQGGFQQNWLHEIIIEMLAADLDRLDQGDQPLPWPDCIPIAHRPELQTKAGLRTRRQDLLNSYGMLGGEQQQRVRSAIVRQNDIPMLFGDNLPCDRLEDLPEPFRNAMRAFFEFAFDLLTRLGLRDENYRNLYNDQNFRDKVCAFCGVEPLDAPGLKREALDHYLLISRYPFAGANFRNLVPMGTKCNSRYKGTQDIIVDVASGNRRLCCDPYDSPSITLSLLKSHPFQGDEVDLTTCPKWVIEWEGGDPDRLKTWKIVFDIDERYRTSSLNTHFRDWIDHFGKWVARERGALQTIAHIRKALLDFATIVVPERYSEAAFLKRATMQMLAHYCDDTDVGRRLVAWLTNVIDYAQAPPGEVDA